MFWRNRMDSNRMDELLEKQDVKLQDVLADSGVIHEVQVYNEKLLNFLIAPENTMEMLRILISTPEPTNNGIIYFNMPHIVSEIFSSYVSVIYSNLTSDPEYLSILFKPFIECNVEGNDNRNWKINSVTCNLIFKVAKLLSQQCTEKLLNFLMTIDNFLDHLLENIDCSSVTEFLVRCITSSSLSSKIQSSFLEWLSKEDLAGKVLSKIDAKNESETVCVKAIQCLTELLISARNVKIANSLKSDLESTRTVSHILSVMLSASINKMSVISSGLEFIKVIFESPDRQGMSSFSISPSGNPIIRSYDILENPNVFNPIIDCLILRLSEFKCILEDTTELRNIKIQTSYGGEIVGPLGPHRLALVDLIYHLVLLEQQRVYFEIVNSGLITTLFNLFFEFHLNTFLHRYVTEIVNKMLMYACEQKAVNDSVDSNDDIGNKILNEIIIKQDLFSKIMDSWDNIMSPVSGSDKLVRNTHRPFLRLMANTLVSCVSTLESIVSTATLEKWKEFTCSKLQIENKRNEVRKFDINSFLESSSEDEHPTEILEDVEAEDTKKLYEECTNQKMTHSFVDYLYQKMSLDDNSSSKGDLYINPLTDFLISTPEDTENAENFEAVCNVILSNKYRPGDYENDGHDFPKSSDLNASVEENNADCCVKNSFSNPMRLLSKDIDIVFREAYKEQNQHQRIEEVKALDNTSSFCSSSSHSERFYFNIGNGLERPKKTLDTNSVHLSNPIRVGCNIVPRLNIGDIDIRQSKIAQNRRVNIRPVLVNSKRTKISVDKETHVGSPNNLEEGDVNFEDEIPSTSSSHLVKGNKKELFEDDSDEDHNNEDEDDDDDDDDVPLSSRLECMKPSENLSQIENKLNERVWNNPSNDREVDTDEVEIQIDTVENVTPNIVYTNCQSLAIANENGLLESNINNGYPDPDSSLPLENISPTEEIENDIQKIEKSSNINISNPFSPTLVRYNMPTVNKRSGSFQAINRSSSAPIKLAAIESDTVSSGLNDEPSDLPNGLELPVDMPTEGQL